MSQFRSNLRWAMRHHPIATMLTIIALAPFFLAIAVLLMVFGLIALVIEILFGG